MTTTQKAFSAFALVLVTDSRREIKEGRGHSPWEGVLINRNTPYMFFFQIGTSSSLVQERSPLACLLKCWKDINPENVCKKALIFFGTQAWSQYPLGDQEKWPEGGTLNYNTILQLGLFCKREGKWTEIPYMHHSFSLKNISNGWNSVR
jgi:hypothetical protein